MSERASYETTIESIKDDQGERVAVHGWRVGRVRERLTSSGLTSAGIRRDETVELLLIACRAAVARDHMSRNPVGINAHANRDASAAAREVTIDGVTYDALRLVVAHDPEMVSLGEETRRLARELGFDGRHNERLATEITSDSYTRHGSWARMSRDGR